MNKPVIQHQHHWLRVLMHWFIAVFTVMVFILGYWMVELDYYHRWYYRAPWWHKGLGVLVFLVVMMRLSVHFVKAKQTKTDWQRFSANIVHGILDILLMVLVLSGYLLVTAKGQAMVIFGLVRIPAITSFSSDSAALFADMHYWAAYGLIFLAILHMLAALKHHFIDKDDTLKSMWHL